MDYVALKKSLCTGLEYTDKSEFIFSTFPQVRNKAVLSTGIQIYGTVLTHVMIGRRSST